MIKKLSFFLIIMLSLSFIAFAQENLPPVTSNLFLWYKIESLKDLSDGSEITTWTNSTGVTNYDLVALSSNKPVYSMSGFNGTPSVHFEMNTPMGTAENIGLFGDPEFSVFFMGIIKTASGYDHPWIWGDGSGETGHPGGASDFEIQNFRVDYATGYSRDATTPNESFSGLLGEIKQLFFCNFYSGSATH